MASGGGAVLSGWRLQMRVPETTISVTMSADDARDPTVRNANVKEDDNSFDFKG
jgi:hypothetical protein